MIIRELRRYKEFKDCYDQEDFAKVAIKLNTSCEYQHPSDQCIYKFNRASDDLWIEDKYSFIKIELSDRTARPIIVPITVYCEGWNEDTRSFSMTSYEVQSVEKWEWR